LKPSESRFEEKRIESELDWAWQKIQLDNMRITTFIVFILFNFNQNALFWAQLLS